MSQDVAWPCSKGICDLQSRPPKCEVKSSTNGTVIINRLWSAMFTTVLGCTAGKDASWEADDGAEVLTGVSEAGSLSFTAAVASLRGGMADLLLCLYAFRARQRARERRSQRQHVKQVLSVLAMGTIWSERVRHNGTWA